MDNMTSNQPYLLRAFYDWIVDNNLTPYIVVDAYIRGVEVPQQFVKDGQIVLNVSPSACVNFNIGLEAISFEARFSGQPMLVYVPCIAVSAIYARENGAGTVFTRSEEELNAFEQSFKDESIKAKEAKPVVLQSVSSISQSKASESSITDAKETTVSTADKANSKTDKNDKLNANNQKTANTSKSEVSKKETTTEEEASKASSKKPSAKKKPSLKVVK